MTEQSVHKQVIGIDPGVQTGIAVWDKDGKQFSIVCSVKIHEAMEVVKSIADMNDVVVRIEDARKRKWFGNAGREQLQGAGSIKRDCGIWESFLTDNKINFELVAPKNNKTKLTAISFNRMTGWNKQTNEHARDAGMLVFGL